MKMKIFAVALVAFVAGWLAHQELAPPAVTGRASVARHWELLNEHKAWLHGPASRHLSIEALEPELSLAVLVAAHELEHVDLVLPRVPYNREIVRHWSQFVKQHPEIVYGVANTEYVEYQPAGESPLHLNLWFRPGAMAVVQSLIKELEQTADTRASGQQRTQETND